MRDVGARLRMALVLGSSLLLAAARVAPVDMLARTFDPVSLTGGSSSMLMADVSQHFARR